MANERRQTVTPLRYIGSISRALSWTAVCIRIPYLCFSRNKAADLKKLLNSVKQSMQFCDSLWKLNIYIHKLLCSKRYQQECVNQTVTGCFDITLTRKGHLGKKKTSYREVWLIICTALFSLFPLRPEPVFGHWRDRVLSGKQRLGEFVKEKEKLYKACIQKILL